MSPTPAIEPSARLEVMPEMNTIRPRASMTLAWEKWPLGLPMRSDTICWRGILGLLSLASVANMLRLKAHAHKPRRDAAQRRDPLHEPQHERRFVPARTRQRREDEPVLHKQLHPLRTDRR